MGDTSADPFDRLHRAHLDERRRIARELHDRVAPLLVIVMHDLELARHFHATDQARALAKLDIAGEHLRSALDQLRAVTEGLRHEPADLSLLEALGAYVSVAGFARPTRISVDGDDGRLCPSVRGELFLILREAIRNAHHHASPSFVEVRVRVTPSGVRAQVRDDGVGFGAQATGRPGIGLASMRERVHAFGGVVIVCPGPVRGTEVVVELPFAGNVGALVD